MKHIASFAWNYDYVVFAVGAVGEAEVLVSLVVLV